MLKKSALALAGLLALASVPAMAASCSGTGCYAMKDGNLVIQSVKAITLGDGTIIQLTVPSDATGTPYSAANPLFTQLGAGSAAIGSITNTGFAISGALPSFATTPVFNLGTLNGAAIAAKQPALGTAGAPAADVLSMQGIDGGKALDTAVKGTPISRSASITTGGTAQQLMAANTARRGWRIQNLSTGDLYVNELGTASAAGDSMKVPAGALYETPPHFVSTGAISVFGATTNQLFYAREF